MENLLTGFDAALSWSNLLFCFLGVTAGMLVGVLPGLGPTTGTAVLLPLTFGMEPVSAIIMLAGIYYGAMYGGTITSVLINTPGEAASVMTCLDGHPLAKQGRAGVALCVAGIGSFIGGTISVVGLALIGPPIARMALKFGPPEYFALMVLGMTMIIGLMGKSLVRGMIAALIGLNLSLVGMDTVSGTVRFGFGNLHLMDGLDFVPLAMGLFGISEIIQSLEQKIRTEKPAKVKGLLPRKDEWKPTLKAIFRGTGLGFLVGLLPGTNSVIPAIMSYSLEKKLAKDPSRFGKGAIEGVAGPETANNSYCGAALVPLFTLGIPSSPVIAILLGAFIMHGLQPGPRLFMDNPIFVWAIIASMFIGNFILLIMNVPLAGIWAKITMVPYKLLYPIILAIAVVGAYSVKNSIFDIGVMFVFGLIGYLLKKAEIPLAPIVLSFVLGSMIESSLLQSLIIYEGNFLLLFTRPISGTLLTASIIIIIFSFIAGLKKKKGMFASDVEM